MSVNLLDLEIDTLLEKFGAGNHIPGSGSAAALQGLISAKLIRTVITLSTEEKRKEQYGEYFSEFLDIDSDIEARIYPELKEYFQKDSDLFDKAIRLRKARDTETDKHVREELAERALDALKPATAMPVDIAKLCIELSQYALIIFDYGFKSARGDSAVALNAAIAAASGCISIIDLNLLSFTRDSWTNGIRREVETIRTEYDRQIVEAKKRQIALMEEAERQDAFYREISSISLTKVNADTITYQDIERLAQRFQNILWDYRDIIWKRNTPTSPNEVLIPERALKALGYTCTKVHTLGEHWVEGGIHKIAGQIDKAERSVIISQQFSPDVQKFTSAHELGHALLHEQTQMHRDRPKEGAKGSGHRDKYELQADKFATYFLMPKKQVEAVFMKLFQREKFVVNKDNAFLFNERSVADFKSKYEDLRAVATLLASTGYFGGASFKSLADQFGVSTQTMAIRLEELSLIEY